MRRTLTPVATGGTQPIQAMPARRFRRTHWRRYSASPVSDVVDELTIIADRLSA